MPMSPQMDVYRRRFSSVPTYVAYMRLGVGGIMFTMDNSIHQEGTFPVGLAVGHTMSYNFGNGLPTAYAETYDERGDTLLLMEERLISFPNILLADGIQANNGLKRYKSAKKSTVKLSIHNHDALLSELWDTEPFIGREIYCKMGFVGLPYIYYFEVYRGTVVRINYSKGKINLSLES